MHEPCGGLDLHNHSSNALAQGPGLFELSSEVIELLLQRGRREGFAARHRRGGESGGEGGKCLGSQGRR